jgi:NAD(P)-dependent dehydrogenase (short-subunit alcohol dehydrogenase family)
MIAGSTAGCIVNIASIAADRAIRNNTAYGVSKAALAALTRYAAQELGPHGIRVVTVAPGPVQTPLTAEAFAGDLRDQLLNRMAVQDVAMPSDVADAVEWIVGAGARFVSGTTVYVDGGYTAS